MVIQCDGSAYIYIISGYNRVILHSKYSDKSLKPHAYVFSHFRVLAFSLSSITSVTVKIDGIHLGQAIHLSGPIFILKWNPRNYSNGTHNIEVIVQVS